MLEPDLFLVFARKFNELGLPYMITGSVAGVLYGEPRMTHDVDLVLALEPGDAIGRLSAAFPLDDFYCPPEEVMLQEASRAQRGHFNLIHHETGFKADVYLANRDAFHAWALGERSAMPLDGETVWVAPIEYVIVRKLEFFREGGSEKHLNDVRAMKRVSGELIRPEVLERWIAHFNLSETWGRVR